MKILGIDYGRAKIGVAVAEGKFSEPLKVIRYSDIATIIQQIKKIVEDEKIDKVVVGVSEGSMAEETKKFLSTIGNQLSTIRFETFDETLTSQDAQRLSREAGISRKKRRGMEDAFAASIMLQNYLDSRGPEELS